MSISTSAVKMPTLRYKNQSGYLMFAMPLKGSHIVGFPNHYIIRSYLHSQAHGREAAGDHYDPQNLYGGQWENR